jgi:F0F1-type ATP synthase delta subunit
MLKKRWLRRSRCRALVRDSKSLHEVWQRAFDSAAQKRAVLDAIVQKAELFRMVRNFVAVLIDKGRMRFLSEIVTQFSAGIESSLGICGGGNHDGA